jgi:hypothetical protein
MWKLLVCLFAYLTVTTVFGKSITRVANSFSLNPSFRKPTYMRHVTARKHAPASDVILPCMTTGVKPITYTWKFNGKRLNRRKRLRITDGR